MYEMKLNDIFHDILWIDIQNRSPESQHEILLHQEQLVSARLREELATWPPKVDKAVTDQLSLRNCIKKHGLVLECNGYTSGFCGLVYHGLPLLEKGARASSIAKTVGPPHLGTPSCLNCEVGFCDVYEVSHKNL